MSQYLFSVLLRLAICIPLLLIEHTATTPLKRVCYWKGSGDDENHIMPESMNTTLCTHIIFGFARLQNVTVVPEVEKDVGRYERLLALKNNQTDLVIMFSIGEQGTPENGFSYSISTDTNRKRLANSIVKFANKYHFDGIDIDWEFPSWGGAPVADKENFVLFLKDVRDAILRNGSNLLLSAAVSAANNIIITAYDVPGMAGQLDFINLMTYDLHIYQWYIPFVGHNSPLFPRKIEKSIFATLNTKWAAKNWVNKGMPKNKIVVGIPIYGYVYELANPLYHDLDAPAVAGIGQWNYVQACQFLASGATRVFDQESQVPYAYKDKVWIGYDDAESVTEKSKWVKTQNYAGVMMWDLNSDDWQKKCGPQKFPLHTAIYNVLG